MKLSSKENLALVSLLAIMFLSSAFVLLPKASADTEAVDTVTLTVPSSCSISGTVSTSHITNVPIDTYVEGIGETTVKTICNDNAGYAIYAIGYTDDTYGKTVLASDTNSDYDIVTGLATTGNTSNWAMKLTAVEGAYTPTIESDTNGTFSDYHIVPSAYTKVVSYDYITDQTTGGSFKTTYSAFSSPSQPAGNYEGQVKYTLVHPASEPAPYTGETTQSGQICYYANASDAIGTMGCQTILSSDTTATLLASNFSRSGYGFAGWSDSFDYATNSNAKFYGPQETIAFTAEQYTGTNNGLSLYAVWVESAGSLQTNATAVCNGLTQAPTDGTANLDSVSALTDSRDSQTYAIAKLADGNCWMIENLRLESTAEHNSDGTLAQGYHSSFAGLANAESANFSNSTTANSLYSTDGSTTKTIDSTGGNLGYRFPRYNNTNTSTRASNPTGNSAAMYSYGNYYTWHAAIADTTYYDSGDHGTTSLCPTGWRLPIGNQSTADRSFGALSVALGGPEGGATANSSSTPTGEVMSTKFRSYPNNFLYSGYFSTSSARSRGSYGYYWSSTAGNYRSSYGLYLVSSGVSPGTDYDYKSYGYSIRCLAS